MQLTIVALVLPPLILLAVPAAAPLRTLARASPPSLPSAAGSPHTWTTPTRSRAGPAFEAPPATSLQVGHGQMRRHTLHPDAGDREVDHFGAAQNRTVSPARAGPSQNCRPASHIFPRAAHLVQLDRPTQTMPSPAPSADRAWSPRAAERVTGWAAATARSAALLRNPGGTGRPG